MRSDQCRATPQACQDTAGGMSHHLPLPAPHSTWHLAFGTLHCDARRMASLAFQPRRTIMSRASQVMAGVVALAFGGVPSLAAGQNKLVAPVHGEAKIEITKPASKPVGKDVVTTILVKNVEKAPIAGFKVEEDLVRQGRQPAGWRQLPPPATAPARRDHHGNAEDASEHQPRSQPGRVRACLRAGQEDRRSQAGSAEAGDVTDHLQC